MADGRMHCCHQKPGYLADGLDIRPSEWIFDDGVEQQTSEWKVQIRGMFILPASLDLIMHDDHPHADLLLLMVMMDIVAAAQKTKVIVETRCASVRVL